MKILLAVLLLAFCVPVAHAQYPKTLTLTVTKITRTPKDTADCTECTTITTVEAHTATANFVLVCEARTFAGQMENNLVCTQFETGIYQAKMLSPEVVDFSPQEGAKTSGGNRVLYSVRVEETRGKS
jgi:hypothetical protein